MRLTRGDIDAAAGGHFLWPSPTWWGVSHDALIWCLPLDSDLRKRGLASRSEFANLQAGGRGFESHHLHPWVLDELAHASAERGSAMVRQAVSSDDAPAAIGPYSQAIVANGLVFCSGTAGIDPATGVAPDGIEELTELALRNLDAVLTAAGASLATLVKT